MKNSRRWLAAMLLCSTVLAACSGTAGGPGAANAPAGSASTPAGSSGTASTPAGSASTSAGSSGATASTSGQAAPVKLTLQRFFGECASDYTGVTDLSKGHGECGIIQVLVNKWNAEHPEAQIETTVVDGGQHYTRLTAAIASGSPPDITIMHGAQLPNFAARNTLVPLGDQFASVGIDTNDLIPTALDYATYNNQVYALPFDIHTMLWHINVDLFKQAGLVDAQGNPKLPTNQDEFVAAAKQMKEKTGKQFVQAQTIDADLGTDWNLFGFVQQQGSKLLSDDLKQANVNTPQALKGVQFWSQLIKDGYTTPDVKDTNAMFFNGDVATLINGTWAVDQFDEQVKSGKTAFKTYLVAPFPTIFGQPAAWSNSHMWALPAQTKQDPAKLKAAVQFLKYLYDNEAQWARTGHLSVRKSVLNSTEYKALPHRSEYAQAAEIAKPLPRISQIDAFQTIMKEEILGVYLGQKAPEKALADAQQRVNDALKSAQ